MHLLEWVFKIEETALTSMLQCKIILSMLLPSLPVLKISSCPVIPDDQRVISWIFITLVIESFLVASNFIL